MLADALQIFADVVAGIKQKREEPRHRNPRPRKERLLSTSPANSHEPRKSCRRTLIKTEPARAVAACRRLAEQGDARAQLELGDLYSTGCGVPLDYAEAVKWFREAAEQGEVKAQFLIGNMYLNGRGVPLNHAEAVGWYRKAAEQGDVLAQFSLGFRYKMMTPSQIEQAQALAAAWRPTTGQ